MLLTSSGNIDKLILVADKQEYHLLMYALELLRDIEIDGSCCDNCANFDKTMQNYATEVIESLWQQETGIPGLGSGEDGGGDSDNEEAPNWMSGNDES